MKHHVFALTLNKNITEPVYMKNLKLLLFSLYDIIMKLQKKLIMCLLSNEYDAHLIEF